MVLVWIKVKLLQSAIILQYLWSNIISRMNVNSVKIIQLNCIDFKIMTVFVVIHFNLNLHRIFHEQIKCRCIVWKKVASLFSSITTISDSVISKPVLVEIWFIQTTCRSREETHYEYYYKSGNQGFWLSS